MSTVIERPLSCRVAEIIGASNIFDGLIVSEDTNIGSLEWNGHRIPARVDGMNGASVTFLLREERFKLGPISHGSANDLHGIEGADNQALKRLTKLCAMVGAD
jgi:ABC-type Fe3+/spermidine/putrescine transport system ATPase subunit